MKEGKEIWGLGFGAGTGGALKGGGGGGRTGVGTVVRRSSPAGRRAEQRQVSRSGAERHSAFLAEANIGAGSQRERQATCRRLAPCTTSSEPHLLHRRRLVLVRWNSAGCSGAARCGEEGRRRWTLECRTPLPESCLPAADLPPTTELALAAARVRQRLTHAAELAALPKNYPTAR